MRPKYFILLLIVMLAGCAYEGKRLGEYLVDPKSVIKDPHFTEYQEKRDQLEKNYLAKKISYADYVDAVKDLDAQYAREVSERDQKISGD